MVVGESVHGVVVSGLARWHKAALPNRAASVNGAA